jgi:hypothetical protein
MAYSAQQAIKAIKDSQGFVTTIAIRLDCTIATVYNLQKRYPSVAEALEAEREKMLDFAESKLFKQIDAENITAIIFFLKTQGKKRGYIERQEATVYNIDPTSLTDEQLQRIAAGDDPLSVVSTTKSGG